MFKLTTFYTALLAAVFNLLFLSNQSAITSGEPLKKNLTTSVDDNGHENDLRPVNHHLKLTFHLNVSKIQNGHPFLATCTLDKWFGVREKNYTVYFYRTNDETVKHLIGRHEIQGKILKIIQVYCGNIFLNNTTKIYCFSSSYTDAPLRSSALYGWAPSRRYRPLGPPLCLPDLRAGSESSQDHLRPGILVRGDGPVRRSRPPSTQSTTHLRLQYMGKRPHTKHERH